MLAPQLIMHKEEIQSISDRARFDFVRYASVWEDADILCQALAASSTGGRILSIASAGDNVLSLLSLDPTEIVACDISDVQLAALDIRIAAFRTLDYSEMLQFLGVTPSDRRWETYDQIRDQLSELSRDFWDASPESIDKGIIHCGKFERYLRIFGQYVMSIVHSKKIRDALIENKSIEEQKLFYREVWNSWIWRTFFKLFFSRFVMGKMGRDPAFFDQVKGNIGKRILLRTEYALTELSTHRNPYLTYIMTGNFRECVLPNYLREENFDNIRSRLDRITVVKGKIPCKDRGTFDGFNLSDIFEYMTIPEFKRCYKDILSVANPGARLAYWNMLVPRSCPKEMEERVSCLEDLSKDLHRKDKAWFYQAFCVDEVGEVDSRLE